MKIFFGYLGFVLFALCVGCISVLLFPAPYSYIFSGAIGLVSGILYPRTLEPKKREEIVK